MSKKCNSCGKFPFCEMTKGPTYSCDNHINREVEMKLEEKDKINFKFDLMLNI